MIFKNFEEIKKNIKTPIENDEFFKMIFSINYPCSANSKFSQQFDYSLNPRNLGVEDYFKVQYDFMQYKVSRMYDNLIQMNDISKKEYMSNNNILMSTDDLMLCLEGMKKINEQEFVNYAKDDFKYASSDLFKNLTTYKKIDEDFCDSGWFYFKNIQTNPVVKEEISAKNVKHRLYLSMDEPDLYKFAKQLATILDEYNLPYTFKVILKSNMKIQQSDTICIYIDTKEHLTQYVNIINSLIKNNCHYKTSTHEVPLHLFRINDLLGYGIQPQDSKSSYSEELGYIVTKLRNKVCKEMIEEYIEGGENDRQRFSVVYGNLEDFKIAKSTEDETTFVKNLISANENKNRNIFLEDFKEKFIYEFENKFKEVFKKDLFLNDFQEEFRQ